jgi:16S rRNA G966 N2-methylase RsmD
MTSHSNIYSNINTLKKVFPEPSNGNYNGLKCDEEGLYSITHPKEADLISEAIIEIVGNNIHIVDMTAGCGGNMISFIKYFSNVTGIEIDKNRFKLLKENLSKYEYNNYELIYGDSTSNNNYTNNNYANNNYANNNYANNNYANYDVYFIDPPWGGPDYKKQSNVELHLSNYKLEEFILTLPKDKLIVLKLPFNYNIDGFKNNIIKKLFINNILILFIKINEI